jgi:hypothetical protein
LNIYTTPCGIPSTIFWLLWSSYVCWIIRFLSYWFLCFISKVLCFVLRSYVCKILGLYHVLMYVCRLHQFVLPRFVCLYWLPMYVDPAVFFVLRSYIYKILYVLMYLDYWFLFLTIFMLVLNSHVCEIVRFFACTELLRSKVKHFIPIKNKMIRWPLKRPRRSDIRSCMYLCT